MQYDVPGTYKEDIKAQVAAWQYVLREMVDDHRRDGQVNPSSSGL
jgi:hypothetical protein